MGEKMAEKGGGHGYELVKISCFKKRCDKWGRAEGGPFGIQIKILVKYPTTLGKRICTCSPICWCRTTKVQNSHPTSSQSADIVGLNVLGGLGEELPGLSWEL